MRFMIACFRTSVTASSTTPRPTKRRVRLAGAFSFGRSFSIGLYQARGSSCHDRYSAGVHHIALTAPSREAVDDLYRVLLDIGAQILDPPREYPKYEPGYYSVFFLDPDGIKLEYVFTPAVKF